MAGNNFQDLDTLHQLNVVIGDINDAGDIVGNFIDGTDFIVTTTGLAPLDIPVDGDVRVAGLNNAGALVANVSDANGLHGLIDDPNSGTTLFDVPGATAGTQVTDINNNGDVVGVNTALANPQANGGFIGIGFAIPSNTAAFAVRFLLNPSHPKPGWLDFTLQDMTGELAQALSLPPETRGAIISVVTPSGPANNASLRPGDVLTKLDGTTLTDARAFIRTIFELPVGKPTHLTVWRDGQAQDVTATIAEWPNYMPGGGVVSEKMARAMMEKECDPGVKLGTISDEARRQYGLDPTLTGALVTSVEPASEANDLGIVPGDVITAVQAGPVATPNDVHRAVSAAQAQRLSYLAVLVQSKNNVRWLSLSIGGAGS